MFIPECTNDECNKRIEEEREKNKVKALVTDRLLFRHWVEVRDRKRTHTFVVASNGGEARDLTPGDFDAPPYAVAGDVDYAFSPDSREIAYLRNPDKVEAISTNSDIYVVPVTGGNSKNITVRNRGYDDSPIYTKDGKYILYQSQARGGFEADRWRLMRYDRATGATTELARGFDLSVGEIVPSSDGSSIYFVRRRTWTVILSIAFANGGAPQKVVSGVYADRFASYAQRHFCLRQQLTRETA